MHLDKVMYNKESKNSIFQDISMQSAIDSLFNKGNKVEGYSENLDVLDFTSRL